MNIVNNSHRFSLYSKAKNFILDPNSFACQSSRRTGFMQRLYYEFLYTQEVKGSCFFYTLTYNDKSIPHYKVSDSLDFPCFSYDDIRLITNGSISKVLFRRFGSRLRYFCACESGEGKGSRGAGFNPHYHFIFFVQPIHVDGKPDFSNYKPISPQFFKRLVLKVWHGTLKPIDYRDARFGIAKEGDNFGLVTGVAPFKYVSKYCLKDVSEFSREEQLRQFWTDHYKSRNIDLQALYNFYTYNSDLIGEPLHNLFYWLGLDKYNRYRKVTTDPDKSYFHYITRYADLDYKVHLTIVNDWFVDRYLPNIVNQRILEYRRLWSPKVRCSKSLGEYGLNFVKFPDSNPKFLIPNASKEVDYQTPCLFYYRKLYYDKYKCDVTGNMLYRLNGRGRALKVSSLSSCITSFVEKVEQSIHIAFNSHLDRSAYNGFREFRVDPLIRSLVKSESKSFLLNSYAIYSIVYKFRSYDVSDMIALDPCISFESALSDYSRFLRNDSFFFDYDIGSVQQRLYYNRDFVSFDSHPCFINYVPLFKSLDRLLDAVSSFRSANAKALFAENSERAKRVNGYLNSFQ